MVETPTDERKKYYRGVEDGTVDVIVNNLCLDAETEILTQDGWKRYDTTRRDDLVANWEDGRIWFSKPKDIIIRKRLPGERMVSLATRQKSIRVAEGHRMLERRFHGRYVHTKSEDLIGKNWRYPVSGHARPSSFPLPAQIQPKGSAVHRKAGQVFLLDSPRRAIA